MQEIIDADYKIESILNKKEAIEFFNNKNMISKAELLKYKEHDDIKIYRCNNHVDLSRSHVTIYRIFKTFDILRYEGLFY